MPFSRCPRCSHLTYTDDTHHDYDITVREDGSEFADVKAISNYHCPECGREWEVRAWPEDDGSDLLPHEEVI